MCKKTMSLVSDDFPFDLGGGSYEEDFDDGSLPPNVC